MEIKSTLDEVDVLAAISFWLTEHKGLNVKEQPVIDWKPGSGSGTGKVTATCVLGHPGDVKKEEKEDA